MIQDRLESDIRDMLPELGIDPETSFTIEHPSDLAHGDYATNVALVGAKRAGRHPRTLAEEVVSKLKAKNDPHIAEIAVAGPGFINVRLSADGLSDILHDAVVLGKAWGAHTFAQGVKVLIEYTDPNPFKEFHIGHLMSNTIGESISRLIEASGAEIKRACYQGDVGLHVAKAIWGKLHAPEYSWGEAYALGATAFDKQDAVKQEITLLNKKLYTREDATLNQLYDEGRTASLRNFETMYARLGTTFDYYFFESTTGAYGKKVVEDHPEIFERSAGAIVYRGDETKGLHTRVFINKEGLPTYEAKELGLAKIKYDTFPYDISIVITGNEVNDYFRVLLDAMAKVYPHLAERTEHYGHGMLRLPTGKMSSRTGDVITATTLIDKARDTIRSKVVDVSDEVAEIAAVAAIKFSILRQAAGKDVVFDFDRSISFEGDSGPYVQYTYARARSILDKASALPIDVRGLKITPLSRLLARFPDITARAARERAPHLVANYLIEIAREFNSYYGNTIILDGAPDQPQKLALTQVLAQTLENGLKLLGIKAPSRM